MKQPQRQSGLNIVTDPVRAEASLWRRYRFENDFGCRETLFNRYFELARAISARLFNRSYRRGERGDFDQFACEGLLQALDRYDPLRGVPFSAYARRRIIGNIVGGISSMSEIGSQLSHRRRLEQERVRALVKADADPLQALTDLAVGLALGLMLDGTGILVDHETADTRAQTHESLAWRETQAMLRDELARLPVNEAAVIRQHYDHGLPFAQIAELLKLSRGRVSQLHHAALQRLRRRLKSGGR